MREVIGKVLENPQGGISWEDGNPQEALCEVLRTQVGEGVAGENVKRGCVEIRKGSKTPFPGILHNSVRASSSTTGLRVTQTEFSSLLINIKALMV